VVVMVVMVLMDKGIKTEAEEVHTTPRIEEEVGLGR